MERLTGLGRYSVEGSSGWGQVFRTVRTFISARSSTYEPAGELPACQIMTPSAPTSTRLKKFTLGDQVARAESPLAEFHQEAVVAVAVVVVAQLLVGAFAILGAHHGGVRAAAEGIVPAHGIVHEGAKDPAHVGVEHEACGEPGDVLRFQSVRHVVALHRAFEVVEQGAHVGAALDIGNAQQRAAFQHMGPARGRLDSFLPQDRGMAH